MKNFHPQFRRPLLTEPDGSRITHHASLVLVCHKGNASQSQASTQVGAQTAGAAVYGNQNKTNTGTNVEAGNARANGSNNTVNTGNLSTTNLGPRSTVIQNSGLDPTLAQQAIDQLTAAFLTSQNQLTSVVKQLAQPPASVPPPAAPATYPPASGTTGTPDPTGTNTPGIIPPASTTPPATTTDTTGTPSPVATFFNLTTWQLFAAVAAVIGTVYLIFKRKKKST